MERRKFLAYLASGSLITALGGSYAWLSAERDHTHLAIDLALQKLDALELGTIKNSGTWEVARIFDHLSQSIDFSMNGYPQPKSEIFQNTVGKLAFNVFQARGKMTHNLAEAIPGETVAVQAESSQVTLAKLKNSLTTFQKFDDPLKPHFAFGQLTKREYALAHVMHINNHLEEFGKA